jgi:hypothetical protein
MTLAYNEIQGVLNKIFQEPLADLIARSNPMLSSLTKRGVASDAIYLKTRMSSDHAAGPIADGSAVTIAGSEQSNYVGGSLPWATYISKFSIPKRLLAQTANNPGVLGRLLQSEIEVAAQDLADRIASDLWAGSVTNGLVGMQSVISDTGTYAGIDRSVAANANWRAVVTDAQGAEISSQLLMAMDANFFNRNRYGFMERPQLFTGMTSAAFLSKYAALLTDVNLAITSGTVPAIQANALNRGMLADFGSLIGFMGIPFVRNANVTPGTGDDPNTSRLYILDPSYWYLATLTPSPEAAVHQALGGQTAPVVDGIRAEIEILGNTGEIVNGYIKTYVQLVCVDPAKGGTVLKNVDTAL